MNNEVQRHETLCFLIEERFGRLHPDEGDAWAAKGYEVITELVEIAQINVGRFSVRLIPTDDFKVIENVVVNAEILRVLRVEDVFLMTIARCQDEWRVVFMSLPYESCLWEDEAVDFGEIREVR